MTVKPHTTEFRLEHMASGCEDIQQVAANYLSQGYRKTDRLYSLADTASASVDLLDPTGQHRILLTNQSDLGAEQAVASSFGGHSILSRAGQHGDFRSYDVPVGSKKLLSVISVAAYEKEYLQELAIRAIRLTRLFRLLDPMAFGVDFSKIALTMQSREVCRQVSSYRDDVSLTVIPPLQPAGQHRVTHNVVASDPDSSYSEDSELIRTELVEAVVQRDKSNVGFLNVPESILRLFA